MTTYEPDSSAEAVVLWDEGISNLTYDQNRGFFIRHDRHTRIKILSTDGYDWANVTVTLYKSGTNKESVGGLRAITHYLEDGKAKSVKMEKSAIFEEEVSESATNLKFTLPNVKVGSVIEYRYELISDFIFNFQDWSFQRDIPTLISSYTAEIPEYFKFEKFMQGYHPLTDIKEDQRYETLASSASTRTSPNNNDLKYTKNITTWLAKDVPAFREEPYMSNFNDYISRINFELAYTRFPNEGTKNYMGTWETINKTILETDSYSTDLNTSGLIPK